MKYHATSIIYQTNIHKTRILNTCLLAYDRAHHSHLVQPCWMRRNCQELTNDYWSKGKFIYCFIL